MKWCVCGCVCLRVYVCARVLVGGCEYVYARVLVGGCEYVDSGSSSGIRSIYIQAQWRSPHSSVVSSGIHIHTSKQVHVVVQ